MSGSRVLSGAKSELVSSSPSLTMLTPQGHSDPQALKDEPFPDETFAMVLYVPEGTMSFFFWRSDFFIIIYYYFIHLIFN